jgi:hypothetical protein
MQSHYIYDNIIDVLSLRSVSYSEQELHFIKNKFHDNDILFQPFVNLDVVMGLVTVQENAGKKISLGSSGSLY